MAPETEAFATSALCAASNGDIHVFCSIVKHGHAIGCALIKNAPILSASLVTVITYTRSGEAQSPRTARMNPAKARGQVAIEPSEQRTLLGHS